MDEDDGNTSSDNVANCTGVYYNPDFVNIAIVSAASAGVSLLTCLCAISVIVLFKKWQSFGQRLLLYLIATVATISAVMVMRRVDYDDDFSESERRFCVYSGFAVETAAWLEINAIVAVTFYLTVGIIWNRLTDKYEVLYFLFIFVSPFVFTWIPFVGGNYGQSGAWCWITLLDTSTCERILLGQVLQVVMYYGPLFLLLPAIILAFLLVLCALRRRKTPRAWAGHVDRVHARESSIVSAETRHLMIYPVIYLVLTTPILVARAQSWAQPTNLVVVLWYVGGVSVNLHGAAMSLAFLLERDTRRRLTWTHLRAAVRDYNSKGGVAKFPVRDCAEQSMTSSSSAATHPRRRPSPSFDHAPNCSGNGGRDELAYTQVTAETVVPVGP